MRSSESHESSTDPELGDLETLFHRALELPARARAALLETVSARRPGLALQVEALLAAEDEPLTILERLHHRAEGFGTRTRIGTSVGDYRLVERIGEGGMSQVYRARRVDDRFDKAVAVKVLKADFDDPVARRRFRDECRILAALEHPSIARLLDAGELEDDTPYVIMELVDGEPIDRFCDHDVLTVDDRLALFQKVCAAVDYAHRHLVVHRDLKPSNILVTRAGEPRLLDFGIAKLLDPDRGAGAGATLTRAQPMTPQYASPEQVRGEPVSTASDTFALGLLLYRLLSGRLPYRFTARTPDELRRYEAGLRALEPPSVACRGGDAETIARARATTPERLRRRLAGDLDAIVLKALRPEKGERYRTADRLAADLARHAAHRPVRARSGALRYRAGAFLRRNRIGIGLAATFAVLLVSLLVAVAFQSVIASRERDRAGQVSAFLTELFEVYNPQHPSGPETVRTLLDRGARRIARQTSISIDERATLLDTLGTIYQRIGAPEAGLPLLEEALALRERLFGPRHPDVATSAIHLAASQIEVGETAAGLVNLERGVALRRELLRADDPLLGEAVRMLGVERWNESDRTVAEDLLQEAVAIFRRAPRARSPRVYSRALGDLGAFYREQGRPEAAEPYLIESLAHIRRWFGDEHPATAYALADLGDLYSDQGRLEQAEASAREALRIIRLFRDADHVQLTFFLSNLADRLAGTGSLVEAEAIRRECLRILGASASSGTNEHATAHQNLAVVLRMRGRLEEAERHYRQALAIRLDQLGPGHPLVGQSYHSLGVLSHQRGVPEEALSLLERARAILEQGDLPADYPGHSFVGVAISRVMIDLGRAEEALPIAERALEIARGAFAPGHWRVGEAELALGGCLAASGREERARPLLSHGRSTVAAAGEARRFALDWAARFEAGAE